MQKNESGKHKAAATGVSVAGVISGMSANA